MPDPDLKKYLKKSPKVVVSVRLDKEVLEWYKKLNKPGGDEGGLDYVFQGRAME